jgi:hypothetical protein
VDILFGLPWLWDVDAHISIRNATIRVGDTGRGEIPREVIGPTLVPSEHHMLMLPPRNPRRIDGKEPDDDDISSDSEDDELSESSDEDKEDPQVFPRSPARR